ncbi:MAG: alpha-L-fucosidase [Fimbriimonadaceae bacterium]|nr:alpha-L-fucosidase [Fimbriimonadaceae bacterium]
MLSVALALAMTTPSAPLPKPDMTWWKEARFGLFIHWGLYAVPAGKWGDQTGYGEWILDSAHIPVSTYERFKDQFNPTKFDANAWMGLAKEAGMKYVVITTKHHDGFALFDSKVSDYDIMATPYKKDVMRQIADAARKNGLVPCWYHSIMDWHHPDYLPRRGWEDRPAEGANFDRYVAYLKEQVEELLTNYGPIGVMWFDGEWESTWIPKYGADLLQHCRRLSPKTIVNNRVSQVRAGMEDSGNAGAENQFAVGDFGTPEQYIPPTGLPGQDWETCMTIGDHWGYNAYETNYKSGKSLIRNLIDIVSKGGNYLLNVGPRADGTFPPQCVERLKEIGAWMKVNSDSIYGTDASPFDVLPWGRVTRKKHGANTQLFLHVFDWPSDGRLVVPGVGNTPAGATILGQRTRNLLPVVREGANLVIKLPKSPANDVSTTVRLEVKGDPIVYRAPKVLSPGALLVDSLPVTLLASKGVDVRYTLDGTEPSARSPLYSAPLTITRSCTLKAVGFHEGKAVTETVVTKFEKVVPRPSDRPAEGLGEGITMREYAGNWDRCPDFSTLTPRLTGVATQVSYLVEKPEEFFGRRYEGFVLVQTPGVYEFSLTSDDGSKLLLGDKVLIDNDGLHSDVAKVGRIALAPGAHRIVLDYFNKTGGAALRLTWAKAGHRHRPIAGSELGRLP